MIKSIRKSLMWKWMFFSILLGTIPLVIAGYNIIQIYQGNLKKSIVEIEKDKAQIVAERTENFFEKVTSLLFSISDENLYKGDLLRIKEHIKNLIYKNDYLEELTLLNREGQELFKVSKYETFDLSNLKNQSKSEIFKTASKGQIYYGEFSLTQYGIPIMMIGVPIKEYKKESFSVLSAKIHLIYLWDLLPQALIGKEGSTFVVNKQGNLLAHSDMTYVLSKSNLRHLPMIDQLINAKEGELEFEYPPGKKYLAVYKSIKKLGGGVVVQVPVEEAYAPLRQITQTALRWILIALGVAVILSLFLTRRLILPIKRLAKEMGEVPKGNLDIYVQPTTKDELGFLTESFNRMVQDLKQSQEALKKTEEKYRTMFEDSKDMVYMTSADGKHTEVNQAGVDLLGYESKEEMMEVNARDTFLYPEDQKRFINEVMREGFVKDFEVKLKRKDGTPIDVLITANAIRDDSGQVIGYDGIVKDISDRKRVEEELVQKTRELEALNEMGALINQSLDLDRVFRVALEKVVSLTGYEDGIIYLANDEEQILERKYQLNPLISLPEETRVIKYGEGVSGKAFSLKQPVITSVEEYLSHRKDPALMKDGIQTLVAFPLLSKGKAIGTITLFSRVCRELSQRDTHLLESLGNQIGIALDNAKLFSNIVDTKEELVQRTKELEALNEMGALINQSLDLDRVFRVALEKVVSLTGYNDGAIYLANEEAQILEKKYHFNPPPTMGEEAKFIKYGEGISGRAFSSKQPVVVSIDEYSSYRIAPTLIKMGIQTLVGFPLLSKGKAIGTITLFSHSRRELSQRDIHLLESIGNQIGLALENAKLFSDVAKAKSEWETTFDAVTDILTIQDKDYRVLRANQTAINRFRLKLGDLGKKKCFEMYYHRDQPCEGCYLAQTFISKKPTTGEKVSQYLNGIFRYYAFPILDEKGEVVAVVDMLREITHEKRLEMEKEVIHNVNKILASSLDIKEVIKAVRIEVNRILDSEKMSITLFDEEEEGFRFFSSEKDYTKEAFVGGVIYPLKGTNLKSVAETGMPVIISNTAESDSWITQKILEEEEIRSFLLFPLEYKGKVIGTMDFASRKTNHFSEAHFNLLRQIAPGLAISIQNALLFEETKKRLDELTILYEITKVSTSSLSLDQMLTEIVGDLNRFFNFEKLGILFVDKNTKRLLPHTSYKGYHTDDIEKLGLCLGKGITGWVAEKGEPLLVNDVREDSRYIPLDEEILSEMCAPLKVGHKLIGVIDAQSKKLNAFSEGDLRLFNIAGGQIATIIENIRLQEEMKESEEKYRTVVEGVLDGVCVIGDNHRILYVNERFAEINGCSREELIGTDAGDYLDEKSKALLADQEDRQKRGIMVAPYLELTILRKDGDTRNVEASARTINDSKGGLNNIVIVKDITEKRKMEEQLLQSEKLRAVGEMASGVAHDFNNALAAILGNTQLLLYTAKEESLKESLKVIEKVAQGSAETVKRLQDFTRGRAHQELSKVDINLVIKDSIEITKLRWKDEAQGKGIHIEMVANLEEVPLASGIASELREVITNMIFNAIEAMPKGGKIGIRTFQKENRIYLQITDTGTGMTEEVRKKAFEPFFTTKPFSNTGLGLSMAYGIIKRFGGEIEVESEIGYGSTFTIILPVGLEEKEEVVLSSMIKIGGKARILVIDDEEPVRNVLSKILTQVKHRVTVAENGEEGLRLFKEKEFDLVLTDLGMPGISGWEVSRAIKKMSPHTPVGMITGWGMEVDQAKLEENGVDFIIPKPFQFNHILKVIGEAIASKLKP